MSTGDTIGMYVSFSLIAIAFGCVVVSLIRRSMRSGFNEYASGAEIDEEELAEAIQGDMLEFIREQNGVSEKNRFTATDVLGGR
jgi:hypothetical protein